MSDNADAIEEGRMAYAENAYDIFPRLCTLITPAGTAVKDDYGETSDAEPTNITDIPCSFKALNAFERAAGGGIIAGSDHKLELPYYFEGELLTVPPNATIRVESDGNYPERTFRVTGPLEDSEEMTQRVAATLIQ